MNNGDLFYLFGLALTASAVIVTFLGLRVDGFPGRLSSLVTLWFIALVGATTTFGVLHSQDEEKHDEPALHHSGEEAEGDAAHEAAGDSEKDAGHGEPASKPADKPAAAAGGGPGDTLALAADPAQIAYDTTQLTSRPGKVTIDFDNPAALEHDVAIERGGEMVARSEVITEAKTSVTAELSPGEYTFLCTVPGHAEAGMEGTLTVE